MHFKNWKRGFGLALLTVSFSLFLAHCGVDGNPFYLALSPTPRLGDVPDAGEEDASQADVVTNDDVVSPDVPADDGSVVPDVVTVDVADGGLITSDQPDDIVVIVDADLADTVDVAIVPDVVPVADVVDAGVGPDVASPPDVVTMPDVVDVVTAMDVVDVVAPQDRPDAVMGADVQDVVMVPDRPDVIMPDIVDVVQDVPPPPPEFLLEYHTQDGENIVPFGSGPVSVIGLSFYADGRWTRRDLSAVRDPRRSNYYTVQIATLSSLERRATRMVFALPLEGCGDRAFRACPTNWEVHWLVTWLGRQYGPGTLVPRPDAAAVPAIVMGRRDRCPDEGFEDTGCVEFRVP